MGETSDNAGPTVLTTPFEEHALATSPDGRWIAYESDETGHTEICDAREMVSVEVTLGEELTLGPQRSLFPIPSDPMVPQGELRSLFDVDVDGQRFLMLREAGREGELQVTVIFNFPTLLAGLTGE